MKKITLLAMVSITLLCLLTSGIAQAQHQHRSANPAKQIQISDPTNDQLARISNAGIDLACGARFKNNNLTLDLNSEEVTLFNKLNIPYETTIDDLRSFYEERNKKALPEAQENLKTLKRQALSNRSLSTQNTVIDNIVQYEGCEEVDWQVPQNFSLGSMGGCLTYSEMLAELDQMRTLYPNLISIKTDASPTNQTTWGNAYTNGGQYNTWPGQTIYYVRISDNPDSDENEPESLFTGMTHSREVASLMNLMYFMWYVLENYDTDASIKNLVDNHEMYFIPVVNPDGLLWNEERAPSGGGMQRKNLNPNANTGPNEQRGVDLNRNFDYFWGGGYLGSSGTASDDTYRGASAMSEPESQIIEDFISTRAIKTAVNHHAVASLIAHSYNGNGSAPPSGREDEYAKFCEESTRYNRFLYGPAPQILYAANGDMSDWMLGGAADANNSTGSGEAILAMAPENSGDGSGFWPNPNNIVSIAQEAVRINFVNAYLSGKLARIHDLNGTDINSTSGNLDLGIEYLGQTLSDITLNVTAVSSNIISITPQATQTAWSKTEYRTLSVPYALDGSVQPNDKIEFQITLSNSDHVIYQTNMIKYYQPTVAFQDDPDNNGISNWTTSGGTWGTTTDAYSGATAITDSPSGAYGNNQTKTLTLNQSFDFSSVQAALVQFHAKWDIERNKDFVQLQARVGTNSWTPLCGKYSKPGAGSNQPTGEPMFEGYGLGAWVMEEVFISTSENSFLSGQSNVQFRFLFDSDAANNADAYNTTFDGFVFDDFKVITLNGNLPTCLDGMVDSFPYTEGFETSTGIWSQGADGTQDDIDWTRDSGGTTSNGTGPSSGSGSTWYLYTEASGNGTGYPTKAAWLTSQCFDFSNHNSAQLEFDYHMYGADMGSITVQASTDDGVTWSTIDNTLSGQQQTSNGAAWLTHTVDLSAFDNQTIRLRFVGTTGYNFASDIAIDNINVSATEDTFSNSEVRKQVVELYPNPATNHLTISLPREYTNENVQTTIHDINGRVVYRSIKELKINTLRINEVVNLKPSMYFISISNEDFSIRKKFLKI